MEGRELFEAAELFVASAATLHPQARWSMDSRAFGIVADRLAKEGNTFAKRFRVWDGTAGTTCHDFDDLLRLSLHAGFLCYLSPEYTHFLLNVSPRYAGHLFKKVTEDDRREALAVVTAFATQTGLYP